MSLAVIGHKTGLIDWAWTEVVPKVSYLKAIWTLVVSAFQELTFLWAYGRDYQIGFAGREFWVSRTEGDQIDFTPWYNPLPEESLSEDFSLDPWNTLTGPLSPHQQEEVL